MDEPYPTGTLAALAIASMAAAGSGTGGGGLYTPLALLTTGSVVLSIPLSKATVAGSSTAALLINLFKRHPISQSSTSVINFGCAALLEPATLAGAILGVVCNSILPNGVVAVLLFAILVLSLRETIRKAVALYAEERPFGEKPKVVKLLERGVYYTSPSIWFRQSTICCKSDDNKLLQADDFFVNSQEKLLNNKNDEKVCEVEFAYMKFNEHQQDELESLVSNQFKPNLKIEYMGALVTILDSIFGWVLLWIVGGPRAIICGRLWEKCLLVLTCLIHVLISVCFAEFLLQIVKKENSVVGHVSQGGYDWISNRRTLAKYYGIGFFAGMASGVLGIGGGLVKAPLLLSMGLNAVSASATSSYMILFTSWSNSLSYLLAGRITLTALLMFASAAFVCGGIGLLSVYYIVKRLKLNAMMAFLLAGLSALSLLALLLSESFFADTRPAYIC